jgi:hypothetical protein
VCCWTGLLLTAGVVDSAVLTLLRLLVLVAIAALPVSSCCRCRCCCCRRRWSRSHRRRRRRRRRRQGRPPEAGAVRGWGLSSASSSSGDPGLLSCWIGTCSRGGDIWISSGSACLCVCVCVGGDGPTVFFFKLKKKDVKKLKNHIVWEILGIVCVGWKGVRYG